MRVRGTRGAIRSSSAARLGRSLVECSFLPSAPADGSWLVVGRALVGCMLLGCAGVPIRLGPNSKLKDVYGHVYTEQYAVVIGVEDYADIGDRHDLDGPGYDACRMAHYLEDQGAKVVCCFETADGKPDFTRPMVPTQDALVALANRFDASNDRVLYYLSGHTTTVKVKQGDKVEERTLFLMPQPAAPPAAEANPQPAASFAHTGLYSKECGASKTPAPLSSGQFARSSGMEFKSNPTMQEARSALRVLLESREKTIDSVELDKLQPHTLDLTEWYRSGEGLPFRGRPLSSVFVADGCDLKVNTVQVKGAESDKRLWDYNSLWILASSAGEQATAVNGHSVFTTYLLQGLNGSADGDPTDGVIEPSELQNFLKAAHLGGTNPKVSYGPGDDGHTVFVNPNLTQDAADNIWRWEPHPFEQHWRDYGYWHIPAALALVVSGVWLYQLSQYDKLRDEYRTAPVPEQASFEDADAARQRAQRWGTGALISGGVAVVFSSVVITWDVVN